MQQNRSIYLYFYATFLLETIFKKKTLITKYTDILTLNSTNTVDPK